MAGGKTLFADFFVHVHPKEKKIVKSLGFLGRGCLVFFSKGQKPAWG